MSTGVIPEGTDPEEIEVKSVEGLARNAGPVDIAGARERETEAWERGKQNASDAAVDVRQDVGAAVVRLPDGDPHATLLVEGAGSDNGPFAGACDCKGYQYHDGPCAHLVTRAVRSILRPGEVPEDVQRYQDLKNAGGPAEADGGQTKAGRARRLSRDEVIRATAEGVDAGAEDLKTGERQDRIGSVTVADVQDMARPRTELKWKTVAKDAWPALVEEWPCFRVEEPSDGSKRLTVDPDKVPVELARLVERSLEREDLANSVVGGREAGGA